jgi:hypothetical protein
LDRDPTNTAIIGHLWPCTEHLATGIRTKQATSASVINMHAPGSITGGKVIDLRVLSPEETKATIDKLNRASGVPLDTFVDVFDGIVERATVRDKPLSVHTMGGE